MKKKRIYWLKRIIYILTYIVEIYFVSLFAAVFIEKIHNGICNAETASVMCWFITLFVVVPEGLKLYIRKSLNERKD